MFLWSKNSYRRTLFIWLAVYSLLMMGCVVAYQYHREKQFRIQELNTELQTINAQLSHGISHHSHGADFGALNNVRSEFNNLRISIIDSNGHLIYDNALASLPPEKHISRRPEITEAMKHGSGYSIRRRSETDGEWYFYSAMKGPHGSIIRTAVPYGAPLQKFLQADFGFVWFMALLTLGMWVLAYILTRRLGQHISRLNDFAKRVERGDKISDIEPFAHDELGKISNHIVRLYARLQRAYADRDREHSAAIRESREKELIKKRLTNNINHELKTPVASIRVCLETLLARENLDPAKRREFLQRCMANTERMTKLLSDVSAITRMDDASETIERKPLNLADIIYDVYTDCEPAATTRGISINLSMPQSLPFIGNESLLYSVFHNLIDNAIAYSGCTDVWLAVYELPHGLSITLADNGTGVAPEHLPRLFERFYRVDTGRSRAAGGTGLGLAIVKNAVRLHGGSITVSNRIDSGLEFNIEFNLNKS